MSEKKSFMHSAGVGLLMFAVLIVITILPFLMFARDAFKSALRFDISGMMQAENTALISLIVLHVAYALVILRVNLLKTDFTKYLAYAALADSVWWAYCLFTN